MKLPLLSVEVADNEIENTGNHQRTLGKMKRIADYCQKDVVTTANIILRFKNITPIGWEDVEVAEG